MAVTEHSEILVGPFECAIDITNKCNYRCKHCYNASGENSVIDNELSDDEFLDFIKNLANLHIYNICFCGGEPLLRLDLVLESANILKSKGVPFISIVSNGYFWNDDVARRIKESGINRVQISLDGACEDTCYKLRGNKDAFKKAINALKLLKKYKFKDTNIAFCPTRFNIDEFEEVCNLCRKLDVKLIRVQPLMLSGRATKFKNELQQDKKQYVEFLKIIDRLNSKYKGNLIINWGDPLDHLYRYGNGDMSFSTFSSIKANGDITVSPYIPLTVGNVKKHKFSDYWENGLPRAWSLDIMKKLVSNILCIEDMGKHVEGVPDTWFEDDISIDIIDDINYRL